MKMRRTINSESGEPLVSLEIDPENKGYPITITLAADQVPLNLREAVGLGSALLAVVAHLEGDDQWTSARSKTE
jgi:hypothetical protein